MYLKKTYFLIVMFLFPVVWHEAAALTGWSNNLLLNQGIEEENIVIDNLMSEYRKWEGVKYRLGGETMQGIDCSALMQKIFHSAFKERLVSPLPRTTAMQIGHGKSIRREHLKPGDMIFFTMNHSERHVGVYIGEQQFIHASTSKGVTISSLDKKYWKSRYTEARRVVQ